MWKNLFLSAFSLSLLNLSKGTEITAFLGDSKTLKWTMDTSPTTGISVKVLHPLIVDTKGGRDNALLFTVLGNQKIQGSSTPAERVSNINKSNANTGHIEFTLNNIREEDGGDYKTEYQVPGQTAIRNIGIRLIVYVKPSKPTITVVSPPVFKKDLDINCVTQSNSKPDDHGLQMQYKWSRNGADIQTDDRYVISGSQLQVKNIQRTDNNTVFTCEAFETESLMSDVSAVYRVDVLYGPESITISPPSEHYVLKENDRLNKVTCSSNCNPACSHSWEKDGSQVSSGQVLNAIENIKRGQAGQYVCKVTNKHGNKESSITVTVQYSPDKPVLRINGNDADVKESLPLSLTCTTQSVPPAKLTIHGSNMTGLNIKDNTLTSTFTIPHANCLDTGLFYCSAENSIGNSKSSGINVNVLCKPRPDHRVSQELKQGLKSGDTMNISGTLISNPKPTIYWSMRHYGSSVSSNLTHNMDDFVVHNYWNIPIITSKATRSAMTPELFGEYVMHAYNEHGKFAMEFTVTEKRKPDGPELTSVSCKPDTSVEIRFVPNFDGGDTQLFSMEMKLDSDDSFKNVGKKLKDNNKNEMALKGPILDLGVSYVFRVTATNVYGTTASINRLTCTIEKESNMGAIIGGATAGGIFIFVLIILLVVFLKRREGNEKRDVVDSMNDKPFNVNQDEPVKDGMKQNILYESAGPRDKPDNQTDKNGNAQKETSINAVYAEVVKPKNKQVNNDVYAEVVKPKGKGKSDGKKGKEKEKKCKTGQQNGDVYENAPKLDASKERPSRRTNNQGLVYIDVEIKGKDKNPKKTVIHGIQNRNEYADVDFTQRADPLPSDDEDDATP